ncbi:hypothetical protein E5A73_06095 [Sphingomonas gei]|uniref:DUF3617 family protein n=1 Tax=Sphingomonas gei TaxID=1395960 RepID=A0A4S1XGD9_9SPHN|nr:hypothetical protein [Sphingomonas gei]TGX55007.1 hypothetical protein E5A73_06095 [Sphingomonas gei]
MSNALFENSRCAMRQIDFAHAPAPDQPIHGEAADALPFGERAIAGWAAGQVDRSRRLLTLRIGDNLMRIALAAAGLLVATACSPSPVSPPANDTAATGPAETAVAAGGDAALNISAPKRRTELWNFSHVAANATNYGPTNCASGRNPKKDTAFRQIGNGGDCTARNFTKTPDGYSYVTVYGVPGMKPVTTKDTLTGDVATGHTLDEVLDLSIEGDSQKIVASRTGDCPSDLTDGQMKDGKMGMVYSVPMR